MCAVLFAVLHFLFWGIYIGLIFFLNGFMLVLWEGRNNLTILFFSPYIIQISSVLILPNAMATYISVFQFMKGILGIIGSCMLECFRLSAIEILYVSSSFCVCASIQNENKSS